MGASYTGANNLEIVIFITLIIIIISYILLSKNNRYNSDVHISKKANNDIFFNEDNNVFKEEDCDNIILKREFEITKDDYIAEQMMKIKKAKSKNHNLWN